MSNATSVAVKDANGASQTVSTLDALMAQLSAGSYASPRATAIRTNTTLDSLFSDDFGGNAVNMSNWTVIDGGLPANPNLGNGVLTQAKIGSGITGMTDSVSGSALTVNMGTTVGAERWYLSNQSFAGKEDVLVILTRSQSYTANSIFIGLVEVDPATLAPLLNPNFAVDSNGSGEFTNRGGCEFAQSTFPTAYQAEAIGDSSSSKAVGVAGVAAASWLTTPQECLIEIDSRDITVSTATVDNITAKASGASRVSTQCPNDRKLYKLLMRFRNLTAPTLNTVVAIPRIMVIDNYEQRVQVSTGEGDTIGQKGVPANIVNSPNVSVVLNAQAAGSTAPNRYKLLSAATTNANTVKTSAGKIIGGVVANLSTSVRFLKFYNQASITTPSAVPGVATPVYTFPLQPNTTYYVTEMIAMLGDQFSTGITIAITGAVADSDTTAIAQNDVVLNLAYI